mmetsp:Transcript_21442/g.48714  ORF Transcript_21442/g.48714 Transcript_21442/m.48714 type:complete len:104 (+) Transcript_21442:229-540(+)
MLTFRFLIINSKHTNFVEIKKSTSKPGNQPPPDHEKSTERGDWTQHLLRTHVQAKTVNGTTEHHRAHGHHLTRQIERRWRRRNNDESTGTLFRRRFTTARAAF